MSKPLSRKYVEDYESDGGFVEAAPKSKKQKSEPRQGPGSMKKDDEGNEYWELTGKRRVQVSQFKGNTMIGIREFYEKDGKALPGKKGISMTVDQYVSFMELMPDIERVLKSKGVTVPRPQFDGTASSSRPDEDEDEGGGDSDGNDEQTNKHRGKLDKFKMKKNHEATSDEDDG